MKSYAGSVASIVLFAAAPAMAENLISDGSFETPVVKKGGYKLFGEGSAVGKWQRYCECDPDPDPEGTVAIVNKSFRQDNYRFPAKDGAQWLDLTGGGTGHTVGVFQQVKTKINATYELSFWTGNVSGGIFGDKSEVLVELGSFRPVLYAVNRTSGTTQVWQHVTTTFVATSEITNIMFVNNDPDGDNHNGLDDVSLTQVSPNK